MIIKIQESDLFTRDTDSRFCKEYNLPKGFWSDLWRRYKALDYSIVDLCDFFELKTKKPMLRITMRRWLQRAEIYNRAQPAVKKGAEVVMSEYFGDMEWNVIRELTKNISVSPSPKAWL